jgi:hypothetical protein
MAIAAQAFKKLNDGAAIVASQQLAFGGTDNDTLAYRGTVTFTLDGSTTAATINWIDGTKALGFTPSGVRISVIGGDQQAAALVYVVPTAYDDKTCTLALSGAGSNTKTIKLLVEIFR